MISAKQQAILTQPMDPCDLTTGKHRLTSSNKPNTKFILPKTVDTGSVLNERFLILSRLGEGGTSTLYKAQLLNTDKNPYYAIKVLSSNYRYQTSYSNSFKQKALYTLDLYHPNLCKIHQYNRDEEVDYIVMELLEGISLRTYLDRAHRETQSIEKKFAILSELSSALHYLHTHNLVHYDLKPNNCILDQKQTLKVIDFGNIQRLETDITNTEKTNQNQHALTPAYSTIEMLNGLSPHPSDDIYALGCIAIELLTGHHPYHWQPAIKAKKICTEIQTLLTKSFSSAQKETLLNAIALKRESRTQSVAEFIEGLNLFLSQRNEKT